MGFRMAITNASERILDEMTAMVNGGICSFKLFMAYKGELMARDDALMACMERARDLNALAMVHAENRDIIDLLVTRALARGDASAISTIRFLALYLVPSGVDRRRVATGQRAGDEEIDDVPVLGMDHGERVEVARPLHARHQRIVAGHELALVGHEELEGADTAVDHRRHVVEHRLAGVGDRHVKPIVDVRGAVGPSRPLLERRLQRVRLTLDGEADQARDAAGAAACVPVL